MRLKAKFRGRTAHGSNLSSRNPITHLFSMRTSYPTPQTCARQQLTDYGSATTSGRSGRPGRRQRCREEITALTRQQLPDPALSPQPPDPASQAPGFCDANFSKDPIFASQNLDPSDRKSTRLNSSHANISYA